MEYISPLNILIFSKTSGYRHDSITAGVAAIQAIAATRGFVKIEATEDAEAAFTSSSLSQYQVVVLLHCTGDFLSGSQVEVLKSYVRAGGGVVAIHGAAAGMLKDEWYGKLIGAHFDSHPDPEAGRVLLETGIEGEGRDGWMDEWYNFRTHPRDNPNLKILLKGDTTSFSGGKMGDDHPLAWYQDFDGGRSYYTALGHFDEAYADEWFVGQVTQAILWAANGLYVPKIPPYSAE